MTTKELNSGLTGHPTSEQAEAIVNLSKCNYAEDLLMADIKKNAPEGAVLYFEYGKHFDSKIEYFKYFHNYLQMWIDGYGWFPCDKEVFEEGLKPL